MRYPCSDVCRGSAQTGTQMTVDHAARYARTIEGPGRQVERSEFWDVFRQAFLNGSRSYSSGEAAVGSSDHFSSAGSDGSGSGVSL